MMIDKNVAISDTATVRFKCDGKLMERELNQSAPFPAGWPPGMWERYRSALDDFLGEVAEELSLVVWYPSGPRVIPTSLQHREAVAREWWLHDTA